jgi:molybdate transport repressor ModE-like protein/molybdopterin-binding protein
MKNVFDAFVVSCDPRDSYAWLTIGKCRIASRLWPGIKKGQRVAVSIRPEDVVLCLENPGPVSARNLLPGHVQSTEFVRDGIEVHLAVGLPLIALLTRKSARDLKIRKGAPVYALFKATAVMPASPVGLRIRVAPVGKNGLIEPARMDLLRAVEREGSLWKAAKALDINYRTAWIWAKEMNRDWGAPLLHRLNGGKGGGGTSLTPEGRAVLREARDLEGTYTG